MSNTFKGSIAQTNVQFPIETVIEPIAGENYSRAVIYAPVSKAEAYLPGVDSATAGTLTVLDASNYGEITGGLLKTWLVPFFKSAQAVKLGVALYNDEEEASTNTLAIVYEKTKFYGYFKFGIADSSAYNALQASLQALCAADDLYSALWIGTSDSNVLSATSTLITALRAAAGRARVIYNPDTTINAALAQLGRSLSTVNATGTPVGNSCDQVAFNTINASGADGLDGIPGNLSATEKTALDNQKIGYNTTVGDGTENVITEGSMYTDGSSVGAEWTKAYITYICKVKTANLITRMNAFRNNGVYQSIILILRDTVKGFQTMGRLANFTVTAPVFADLPATSGDGITVPNAWQADYVDNTRTVAVYGTLYLTQPSK